MPKSTRELTTVYTGLTLVDFEKFSSLASAKNLSRSELAREAIKFYLTWHGQVINLTGAGAISQLFERMNKTLVESYPSENSVFNNDFSTEDESAERAEALTWHEAEEENIDRLVNLEPNSAANRLEQVLEKIERTAAFLIDRQNSAVLLEDKLQQFDRRISEVIAKVSSNVEIGNARIENLQDQFQEVEKNLASYIDASLGDLKASLGKIPEALDNRTAKQTAEQDGGSIDLEEQIQRFEGRMLGLLDNRLQANSAAIRDAITGLQGESVKDAEELTTVLMTFEERLSATLSRTISGLQREHKLENKNEFRELLQATENRICAQIAENSPQLDGSMLANSKQVQSVEMDNFVRAMLKSIAIEVSLLHYVLWRNQPGDAEQLFTVAKARAGERVRKWLEQLENDPFTSMHQY